MDVELLLPQSRTPVVDFSFVSLCKYLSTAGLREQHQDAYKSGRVFWSLAQSINVGKPSSVSPLLAKAKDFCAYLLVQAACPVKYKYGVRSVTQCSLYRILSCVAKNEFRSYSLFTEQEVCMGESWPRSWIQKKRSEVSTQTEAKILPYRPTKLGW